MAPDVIQMLEQQARKYEVMARQFPRGSAAHRAASVTAAESRKAMEECIKAHIASAGDRGMGVITIDARRGIFDV